MTVSLDIELQYQGKRFKEAAKGLEALANDLGQVEVRLPRILARELERYLDAAREALRSRHSKPWGPGNAPATGESTLLRRTGEGLAGIRTRVTHGNSVDSVAGFLEVPFPLSVHEQGATVRARRARYLTIPLPDALDSRGVPLRPSARDWDSTFVAESRRGNLLVFQRRGRGLVPLYLLRREVKLPPRLRAEETLAAGAQFFSDTAIDAIAREVLGR